MKNLKLIDGLLMLRKEEWISFRKYILMYCSKTSDNYKLLDFLFSIRGNLSEHPDLETIKKPLFDEMTVKSFSNLMSRIFNWFEEWLIWYMNKKDKVACDIELVKIYNRKGAFNLADKTYRRVEKNILNENRLDLSRDKNLYQLHHNHYFSDNPVKYRRHGEILESLVSFYLLQFKEQSFLYIAELHNWGVNQNHDYSKEIDLLTEMGGLIKDSKTSGVINLIIRTVSELDKEAYMELRTVVMTNQIKPDTELYILATFYTVNFSMRLWNSGKITNPQIVMDAYDFGLRSGVLISTGKMPVVRFLKMIGTLGLIETSTKTYKFIDKWIHLVDSENLESIHAVAYAHLKFIERKYDDIIPLLLGKKYSEDAIKLRASSLELISLYSDRQNNYSLLRNRLNNFKRVLRSIGRTKSNITYLSYMNFAKILDLLIKRDFLKMRISIENYSPIVYKKWLETEIKAGQK